MSVHCERTYVYFHAPQGDLSHWTAVLNHFDDFFEKHIKPRADIQLKGAEGSAGDPPFPAATCLAVLKATAVILENCGNKHLYQSYEVSSHQPAVGPCGDRCQPLVLLSA